METQVNAPELLPELKQILLAKVNALENSHRTGLNIEGMAHNIKNITAFDEIKEQFQEVTCLLTQQSSIKNRLHELKKSDAPGNFNSPKR